MATTEAKYSFTTKFNGDLLTARGDTIEEFTQSLLSLADPALPGLLTAVQGNSGHAVAPAAPAAPVWGATHAQDAAPAAPVTGFQCQHGARTYKTGKSAKGVWEAYFCPQRGSDCKPMNKDGSFWK